MTREEPSLETSWLQNIETIDKVQRIDRSNKISSQRKHNSVATHKTNIWNTLVFQKHTRFLALRFKVTIFLPSQNVHVSVVLEFCSIYKRIKFATPRYARNGPEDVTKIRKNNCVYEEQNLIPKPLLFSSRNKTTLEIICTLNTRFSQRR
jgi:hypothetical protein